MKIAKPLTPTQGAYVSMVLGEHANAIRLADAMRDQRMTVLLRESGIPDGIPVQWERQADGVMALTYEDGGESPATDPAVIPVDEVRNQPGESPHGA